MVDSANRMRSAPFALAVAVVALAITATSASAATRAEWVAQVDPICQSGETQEQALLQPLIKRSKRLDRRDTLNRKATRRLERAYRRYFLQYANVERAVNSQIATIPPAAEDVSLVQVWLRARGELVDLETGLFSGKGGKSFGKFFSEIFELFGREFEARDLVRDFGFQHCSQAEIAVVFGGIADISPKK
jgi:hypothetical protein